MKFSIVFFIAGLVLCVSQGFSEGVHAASAPAPDLSLPVPDSYSPDLDRGIVRSLNIEESWVENAFYIHWENADSFSRGSSNSLSGELDFSLNDHLGGEVDFPLLLLTDPLGSGPAALGPVAAGIRVVPWQFGTEVTRQSGILAFEVEGSFWPAPQLATFPGEGNSVTPEVLWAFRERRVYFQGITGYTMPAGPGAVANPFFYISAGRTWEQLWAFQLEADFNGAVLLPDGKTVPGETFIPEIAYLPFGDLWLNEIGEGLCACGPGGLQPATFFMTEVEFRGL